MLFGKLNFETYNNQLYLYSLEESNDILFDMRLGLNSSMPYSIHTGSSGDYHYYNRYNTSAAGILMNRSNPGAAIDLGLIYKRSENLTFSASILDLGFIKYRSNLTNYSLSGHYFYQGDWGKYPAEDSLVTKVFNELNDNISDSLSYDPYIHTLDPRAYFGISYKLTNTSNLNFLLYSRFFSNHIQTGGTLSYQAKIFRNLNTSISWSYMNNSLSNFGIGIDYRNDPIQLYLVSDNILGVFMPYQFNNTNLRFGINIHFGLISNQNIKSGWGLKERQKYRKLRKGKNVNNFD